MLANYLPSSCGWMAGGDDLREPALKRLQVITGHLLQVVGHGETAPRGLGSHVRTSYYKRKLVLSREGGAIGLLIALVPKALK